MADPITLTAASMALTAASGGITAAGTIAGGNTAAAAGRIKKQAADREALQIEMNAAGELAASQRRMFDTRLKTRMTQSTLTARAAASGFDASAGSMLTNAGDIAQRGEFQALMDVFNGLNTQSGLINKAEAVRAGGRAEEWAGEQAQDASYLSAAGTIAGTAGSMLKSYGSFKFPTTGRASYG